MNAKVQEILRKSAYNFAIKCGASEEEAIKAGEDKIKSTQGFFCFRVYFTYGRVGVYSLTSSVTRCSFNNTNIEKRFYITKEKNNYFIWILKKFVLSLS